VARKAGVAAVAVLVDGELRDLRDRAEGGREVKLLTLSDPEALEVLRHTAAHVLAQAVRRLFPGVKLAIGPAIADGFYYDFDFPQPITREDLARIEEEMRKIVAEDYPVERVFLPRAEAQELLEKEGEVYKLELLSDIPDQEISFYRQGEFMDLCRGPHLPSTGLVKHFKLLDLAGAYWRGDSTRVMLTRIYGTAFASAGALEEHLRWREEARRRDHRRLGPELDLFSINNEAIGAGWCSGIPKAPGCGTRSRPFGRNATSRPATSSFIPPISAAPACGSSPDTWTSTGRGCTPPWISRGRSSTSSP